MVLALSNPNNIYFQVHRELKSHIHELQDIILHDENEIIIKQMNFEDFVPSILYPCTEFLGATTFWVMLTV